jgi:diaminopimelate epimerase
VKVHFAKYSGCGNDFILIDARSLPPLPPSKIKELCDRNHGIGADGVILLERSLHAHLKMRVFNADGSEADMCGNGIRCLHAFARELSFPAALSIETLAGIYQTSEPTPASGDLRFVQVGIDTLKLGMTPLHVDGIDCISTNTGNPHLVCPVDTLHTIDVDTLGKKLRRHPAFNPEGTNVNFVQTIEKNKLSLRTYERGVEKETLACGTGALAAAYVHMATTGDLVGTRLIEVETRSGETLNAKFTCELGEVTSVELAGPARKVFEGNFVFNN